MAARDVGKTNWEINSRTGTKSSKSYGYFSYKNIVYFGAQVENIAKIFKFKSSENVAT